MRNQRALTTSTGGVWLVVGAILCAVCVAVLLLQVRNSVGAAVGGAVVVAALYAGMVLVRVSVRAGRARLITMAVIFGAMAAWTLVWLIVIGARR